MTTGKTLKWAILTSRWGRNAKDLIESYGDGKLRHSEISLLVYDAEPSGALEAARNTGVDAVKLSLEDFKNKTAFQHQILLELQKKNIDYILLLSFKHLIRKELLEAYQERIINIHPSLFPSFLNTHTAIQEAIEYGVKISGITTHIIDDKVDAGTIVCQEPIRFGDNETFDSVYPKFAETANKILLDTISKVENSHFNSE